jgi:hypothetical protein
MKALTNFRVVKCVLVNIFSSEVKNGTPSCSVENCAIKHGSDKANSATHTKVRFNLLE